MLDESRRELLELVPLAALVGDETVERRPHAPERRPGSPRTAAGAAALAAAAVLAAEFFTNPPTDTKAPRAADASVSVARIRSSSPVPERSVPKPKGKAREPRRLPAREPERRVSRPPVPHPPPFRPTPEPTARPSAPPVVPAATPVTPTASCEFEPSCGTAP